MCFRIEQSHPSTPSNAREPSEGEKSRERQPLPVVGPPRAGQAATGYALRSLPRATFSAHEEASTQRHKEPTLIHSRPPCESASTPAQNSVGTVAQIWLGADTWRASSTAAAPRCALPHRRGAGRHGRRAGDRRGEDDPVTSGTLLHFKARADAALADRTLKIAIDRTTGTAERKRAAALADFPAVRRRRASAGKRDQGPRDRPPRPLSGRVRAQRHRLRRQGALGSHGGRGLRASSSTSAATAGRASA